MIFLSLRSGNGSETTWPISDPRTNTKAIAIIASAAHLRRGFSLFLRSARGCGDFLLIKFLGSRPAQEQDGAGHHDEGGQQHQPSLDAAVVKVLVFNQGLIGNPFSAKAECRESFHGVDLAIR